MAASKAGSLKKKTVTPKERVRKTAAKKPAASRKKVAGQMATRKKKATTRKKRPARLKREVDVAERKKQPQDIASMTGLPGFGGTTP